MAKLFAENCGDRYTSQVQVSPAQSLLDVRLLAAEPANSVLTTVLKGLSCCNDAKLAAAETGAASVHSSDRCSVCQCWVHSCAQAKPGASVVVAGVSVVGASALVVAATVVVGAAVVGAGVPLGALVRAVEAGADVPLGALVPLLGGATDGPEGGAALWQVSQPDSVVSS